MKKYNNQFHQLFLSSSSMDVSIDVHCATIRIINHCRQSCNYRTVIISLLFKNFTMYSSKNIDILE